MPSAQSPKDGDAITNANTPVMDDFAKSATGYTELEASSLAVGLPEGLMGNSEVGHLNIGAGRVVWQDVVRIDQAIKKDEFANNDVIKKTLEAAKNSNGRLHLCGLVSHGGVVGFFDRGIRKETCHSCMADSFVLPLARQAGTSIRSPQGRQEVRGAQGLHPLLWRWS